MRKAGHQRAPSCQRSGLAAVLPGRCSRRSCSCCAIDSRLGCNRSGLACRLFRGSRFCGASLARLDSGLDGWTLVGNGSLSHNMTGGNPDGYAHWQDNFGPNGDGWAVAPAKFLGSWQSYTNSGVVTWDHRIINPDGTTILYARAEVSGPSGAAYYQSPVLMNTNWTSFSVPLKQSSWSITSGSWAGMITNVTSFKIRLEAVWGGGYDSDGIDNVWVGMTNQVTANIAPAVEIFFATVTGMIHQVQYCTDLVQSNWMNLGSPIAGDGQEKSVYDSTRSGTSRLYRVTIP